MLDILIVIQGHLKRESRQIVHRNNIYNKNNSNRRPQPFGEYRRCGKGHHWTDECRSRRDRQGNPLSTGNA